MASQTASSMLVSVIVPTHNRAELLARAIDSVLAQSYAAVEIIVVDDASTDRTAEIVGRFPGSVVRYVRHDVSRGAACARNTGVRHARGAIIGFLDDDDEWERHKLERQLPYLRRYAAVMCTARVSGRDMSLRRPPECVDSTILRRRMFPYGGIGVLLARSNVVREIAFDERLPKYQDWDLTIRIAERYVIAYLNEPLVRFNDGGHERISNRIARLSAAELLSRYRLFFDKHHAFFGDRWYRFHLAALLLYRVRHRPQPWRLLGDAIRWCGPIAVARVLSKRAGQLAAARYVRRWIKLDRETRQGATLATK